MKERRSVQFLLVLMVGILPARLSAQISVPPEKFVFVQSIGSAPPPVTTSTIFKSPRGVSIGASASPGSISGTTFVADPDNNQVVAFPPGSSTPTLLSTLTCSICTWTSPPSPWTLSQPSFVAAAPNGNIWISDTGNDVVVEVDPTSASVVAFAGVGPTPVAVGCGIFGCGSPPPHPNAGQNAGQFFGPGPLAVDFAGNVYVADAAGDVFLGADSSGAFHLGCVGAGAANCPQAANFRIEKFRSDGAFLTSWGSFCSFSSTTGVVDDSNGDVIAGTAGNTCDTSAPGANASGDGELAYVTGIAVDSGPNVYVADADNNRIQKFRSDGSFRLKWGGLPTGNSDGQLNGPAGIAVDTLDQSIYVVDVFNDRIEQFDGSGTFLSKGGSKGAFEAQFDEPVDIATVPGNIALGCLLAGPPNDCTHAFVVSEQGRQKRVQFLAARSDKDNDSITDEVDVQPTTFSNDFSNASLGFTTTGSIVDRGQQTFTIYNLVSPSPADIARLGSGACNSTGCDEIRIRTETFGGSTPLQVTFCTPTATLSLGAGMGIDVHCSTPTVFTEEGPVGFRFVGRDGTIATATLNTGDSLSVDVNASQIISNAGTIVVVVGGKSVSLSPGQSTFVDNTPPTTTATVSPLPNAAGWNNSNVTVNLASIDNPGGSGVKQITYSASGAQTVASTVVSGGLTTFVISVEGITTIIFFGTDNAGNIEAAKAITIKLDKTPPTVVCSASPSLLPPNQRLVPVTVSVSLTDSLSGPNGFVLSSVTSNERQPDNDVGNDIKGFTVGTPSTSGFLRAERSLRDRIYTLVYTGSDVAGNHASCTAVVRVARHHEEDHDRDHDSDHDRKHDKEHHAEDDKQ